MKLKCLLLKNYFSSSEQCFSSAERRLSGLINADGKVRRILMTPVLLAWDWEFLNTPVFNLILMLPNLAKLLLVRFFLSVTLHWNFWPFQSFLGHGYIRCIIHSWSLSKQHSMTSEVCWKPVPRQVYFTINHAHWRLWLYFWYVSGSCFSCSQMIFIIFSLIILLVWTLWEHFLGRQRKPTYLRPVYTSPWTWSWQCLSSFGGLHVGVTWQLMH